MEFTKNESEFLNVLCTAWVQGWYAGRGGNTTDERKLQDCPDIMKRYPKYVAAPELLEVCDHFSEWQANHFGDFDDEINGQLLCLSNEAQTVIKAATN